MFPEASVEPNLASGWNQCDADIYAVLCRMRFTRNCGQLVESVTCMSIDKNSDGVPEVDMGRRTSKVNLGVVIGVVLFLAAMGAVIFWFSGQGS